MPRTRDLRIARRLLLLWVAAAPLPALAQATPPAISTVVAISGSQLGSAPVRGTDGALYGTTSVSTFVAGGLIYRAAADGTSMRTIYQIKPADGLNPIGGLMLSAVDNLLYGTTNSGAVTQNNTSGTVFRVAQDGSAFAVLHRFANYTSFNSLGLPVNTDGASPETELVEGGDGALYGVTRSGGPSGTGVVFRMARDGRQFSVLHAFDGVFRPVTFDDPGVTYVLAGFDGAEDSTLVADPVNAGNRVARVVKSATAAATAGTTVSTGANASVDAVPFSATGTRVTVRVYPSKAGVPVRLRFQDAADATRSVETEASTTRVNEWETLTFDFANPASGTPALNPDYTYNRLTIHFDYGRSGAAGGNGTYHFEEVRFTGSGASVSSANRDGLNPLGPLVIGADGFLYGTTSGGGAGGSGTVFRLGLDGSGFETVYAFSPTSITSGASLNADGAAPVAGLTDGNDGRLYGVTTIGGPTGHGTVFAFDPVGRQYTNLHSFDGTGGSRPTGELLLAADGKLYGSTATGGSNAAGTATSFGTLFSIGRDGTGVGLSTLRSFDGNNGSSPTGRMLQLNGTTLAGVAAGGAQCGQGAIYQLSLTGATVNGITNCGGSDSGGGSLGPLVLLLLGALGVARRRRAG
jgi:MYXO-CTERM domain-containing protein